MELQFSPSSSNAQNTLVFIDEGVDNFQQLLSQSNHPIEILDSSQDGIKQITSTLAKYQDIDAIGIFAHGDAGLMQLGNTTLTQSNIHQYRKDFEAWSDSLSENADLLTFPCNLAANPSGVNLIETLSAYTGTDVAASTDITGNTLGSADWDLEYHSGLIETNVFEISEEWRGELFIDIDNVFDSVGDGFDSLGDILAGSFDFAVDTLSDIIGSIYSEVTEFVENPIDYVKDESFKYVINVFKSVEKLIDEGENLIKKIVEFEDVGDIIDILSQTIDILTQAVKVYASFLGQGEEPKKEEAQQSAKQLILVSDKASNLLNLSEQFIAEAVANGDLQNTQLLSEKVEVVRAKNKAIDLDSILSVLTPELFPVVPSPSNDSQSTPAKSSQVSNFSIDDLSFDRKDGTLNLNISVENAATINNDVAYRVLFLDAANNVIGEGVNGRFSLRQDVDQQMVKIPFQEYFGIDSIPSGAQKVRVQLDPRNRIQESNERDNTLTSRKIYQVISNDEALQYVASNADLIQSIGTNIREAKKHFVNFGSTENRPTESFDTEQSD